VLRAALVFAGDAAGLAGAIGALAAETVAAELRDRLGPDTVELGSLSPGIQGPALDGVPALPLLPWDPSRAESVARATASAVVTMVGPGSEAARAIVDDLSARGVYVEVIPLGGASPDPLILSARLHTDEQIQLRAELLRLSEALPSAGEYIVGHVENGPPGVDVAIESFAYRSGRELRPLGSEPSPLDLAAYVAGASVVVTDSTALASVAGAHRRPTVLLAPGAPLLDRLPAEWPSAEGPSAEWLHERVGSVEIFLDGLATRVGGERARLAARSDADVVAELEERVRVLGEVNTALRRRLDGERAALVALLRARGRLPAGGRLPARGQLPAGGPPGGSPGPTHAALEEARAEARRAQEELDRLYATKTMRAVEPVRNLYRRVRSILR
jgi:hypothetical protein